MTRTTRMRKDNNKKTLTRMRTRMEKDDRTTKRRTRMRRTEQRQVEGATIQFQGAQKDPGDRLPADDIIGPGLANFVGAMNLSKL
jgi:hypothetical protein